MVEKQNYEKFDNFGNIDSVILEISINGRK